MRARDYDRHVRSKHWPLAWRLALDAASVEIVTALREAGIRSLLFKGPVLAAWLYKPGERIYGDIDLLVSPTDFSRAGDILARLGFSAPLAGTRPGELEDHEQLWLRPPLRVDLHCSVSGIGAEAALTWPTLSRHTDWISIGPTRLETPTRPTQAFLAALHAAYPGGVEKPLEDLRRMIDNTDDALWMKAAELARELDAQGSFIIGLDRVSEGRPLVDRLGLERAASAEVHLAATVPPPAAIGMLKLISTPTLTGRFRLLLSELAPSPPLMRWMYPIARQGDVGLAAAYAWRPLDLCLKAPAALRAVRAAQRAAR
jgi:hypothetical protein